MMMKVVFGVSRQGYRGLHGCHEKAGSQKTAKQHEKAKLQETVLKQRDSRGPDFDQPHLLFLKFRLPHIILCLFCTWSTFCFSLVVVLMFYHMLFVTVISLMDEHQSSFL